MFRKITRKSLEKFLAKHGSKERILDIGSGGSTYGKFFPNRLAVDIDPARKPDIVADAHTLPFKDGEFGTILCTEVLEHLTNPPQAVSEMHRVLKDGGKLILTTRFVYPLHDAPHDYFRYTKFGLRHLFKDWKDVDIVPEVGTMSTVGVLLQRITLQSDMRGGKFTKAILLVMSQIMTMTEWLIKREYADILRSHQESDILASGYYLTARK